MIDLAVNIEVRKEFGLILVLLRGVMAIINLLTAGHQSGAAPRLLDVRIMILTVTIVIDIIVSLSPTWTETAARGSSFLTGKVSTEVNTWRPRRITMMVVLVF